MATLQQTENGASWWITFLWYARISVFSLFFLYIQAQNSSKPTQLVAILQYITTQEKIVENSVLGYRNRKQVYCIDISLKSCVYCYCSPQTSIPNYNSIRNQCEIPLFTSSRSRNASVNNVRSAVFNHMLHHSWSSSATTFEIQSIFGGLSRQNNKIAALRNRLN